MTPPSCSRRRVLKLAGVVLLSGAASQLLHVPLVRAAGEPAHWAEFSRVSAVLTGRDAPDQALAHALYGALVTAVDGFEANLPALDAGLQAAGDEPLAALDAPLKALAQMILQGWYLGVVGSGTRAICVAYVDCLSQQVVADVLVPQSYSYGPCGSWAAKP